MKTRLAFLASFVVLIVALAATTTATAGPGGSDGATMCVSTTQLLAENEVPTSNSTSFGVTQIKVRNDGTIEFNTHIVNPDGETFAAGHIHIGPEGVAGPVVQSLFQGGPTTDPQIMQSGAVANPTLAAAICANPSAYYVNYHTAQVPSGAVRGQLG
jgi:hypothetical protein